ncbi:MAG TPA: twin-arginine translocase subunit TatC [Vicinamibacterales bacterium]|nr:twin-arginine translocase subunit TatC [Vicinamibacterales bacterium]
MAKAPLRRIDDDDHSDARMGFLEHLEELRVRLIRCCIAIAIGMLIAFAFVDRLVDTLLASIERALPAGTSLVFIKPPEGFSLWLNVALVAGLLLAAPFVMYQVWRFIAPGLYANEKKFAIPFVALTSLGSVSGALFSHYLLFPSTMRFFSTFSSPRMRFMPGVEDTIDLYLKMMLGMMVVFQIPTVVFFLARMRVVTARFLWRNTQYAILAISIISAVLTPSTDPWNQIAFALPMLALYMFSIGLAWIVGPKGPAEPNRATPLRLVFAASVLDQARRSRRTSRNGLRRVT